MYAYLNVYTNFPWEIKYGGKFDLCAAYGPNHTILTSSVKAIMKAITDTVFLVPCSGGVRIFHLLWEYFPTRERVLGGSLAGSSLIYLRTMLILYHHTALPSNKEHLVVTEWDY